MFKLNNENQIVGNKSLTEFIKKKFTGGKALNKTKHFHPATKEWVNSVYFYNKDFLKTMPAADNAVNRLIKSYFSISPILNKKKTRRVELRFKRLSLNRVLVSKAEMKHTNNKVVVTVYLYNKNKKTMLYRLKNLYNSLYYSVGKKITSLKTSEINKNTTNNITPSANAAREIIRDGDRFALNDSNVNKGGLKITNYYYDENVKLDRRVKKKNAFIASRKNSWLWKTKKTIWKSIDLNLENTNKTIWKSIDLNLENSTMSNNQKTSLVNSDIVNKINTKKSRAKKNEKFFMRNNKLFPGLTFSDPSTRAKKTRNLPVSPKHNVKNLASNNNISLISQLTKVNLNRFNIFFSNLLNRLNLPSISPNAEGEKKENVTTPDAVHETIMPLKEMYLTLLKKSNPTMFSNKYNFCHEAPSALDFSSSDAGRTVDNNIPVSHDDVMHSPDISDNMQTSSLNNSILFNYNYGAKIKHLSLSSLTTNKAKHAQDINVNSKSLSITQRKHSNGLLIKLNNLYKLFVLDYLTNNSPSLSLKDNSESYFSGILGKNTFNPETGKISNDNVKQDSALRLKLISAKSVNIINKVRKYKTFLLKILRWNNKTFANYETKYYKKFFKKVYRKEFLYLYYTKMLSLNNIKFKNWFLLGLKKVLSNIYKKKIEFNFVNLNYLHLNSDIFSESIAVKLRNRDNRLLTVLRKALSLVKLFKINNRVFYGRKYHTINYNDKVTKDLTDLARSARSVKNDILNTVLQSLFTNSTTNNRESSSNSFLQSGDKKPLNSTQINALDSIKHKAVFGVRLEAAGRLSKRLTASRSVFKLRYKGSLKNIDSSYHGLSSTILRGNTKSNLQYTKVSSKTRNGAFGLKGWVSGY